MSAAPRRVRLYLGDDSLPWATIREAMGLAGLGVCEGAGDNCDLAIMPASHFGTGDTIALSISAITPAPGGAVLVLAEPQSTARWRQAMAEQIRAAAILFAPAMRINALILPSQAKGAGAQSLAEVVAYLADAEAVTGQVLELSGA